MNSKLTPDQAFAIARDPRRQKVIAAVYGVSIATVSHIKTGVSWGGLVHGPRSIEKQHALELLRHQVSLCLCVHLSDLRIAELLGITYYRATQIVKSLLDQTGMGNRFEFAIQQNAAVREEFWGREEAA